MSETDHWIRDARRFDKDVAGQFGISRSMVGAIASGKRWKHVGASE